MTHPTTAASRIPEPPAPTRAVSVAQAPPSLPAGPRPAPASTASPPLNPTEDGAGVMLEFQRLMHRFLETQQAIMLAYLQRGDEGSGIPGGAMTAPMRIVVPPTPPLTPPGASSSCDAGFETPQPAGRLSAVLADAPPPAPQPAAAIPGPESGQGHPTANVETITRGLLQIVSDRTGYPADMLGLDLNMEADLGIDSIKRVEILGVLQREYLPGGWGKKSGAMEELTRIKTLRGIVEWVHEALGKGNGNGPAADPVPRFVVTAIEAPLEGGADTGGRA